MSENAKTATAEVKEIFEESKKLEPGTVPTSEKGYYITSETMFRFLLGVMKIKRYQSLPLIKAVAELEKNKVAIVAFLDELLEESLRKGEG